MFSTDTDTLQFGHRILDRHHLSCQSHVVSVATFRFAPNGDPATERQTKTTLHGRQPDPQQIYLRWAFIPLDAHPRYTASAQFPFVGGIVAVELCLDVPLGVFFFWGGGSNRARSSTCAHIACRFLTIGEVRGDRFWGWGWGVGSERGRRFVPPTPRLYRGSSDKHDCP